MLRYSLATLFLVLLYASVGCAALVNSSGIWPQVAVTMAVATLLLFTLAALCWQDRARRFALGFSITGWIYFLLVFPSAVDVRGHLLTDTAVTWLFKTIHGDQPVGGYVLTVQTPNGPGRLSFTAMSTVTPSPPRFVAQAAYTATAQTNVPSDLL